VECSQLGLFSVRSAMLTMWCPISLSGKISTFLEAVLRIRIRRIHVFLGLLDPDPLVRGADPDPSIIKQK
jgi:hypothetical protein